MYLVTNRSYRGAKITTAKLFSTAEKLYIYLYSIYGENKYFKDKGYNFEWWINSYNVPGVYEIKPDSHEPIKAIRRGKKLWELIKSSIPKDTQLSLSLG